MLERVVVLKQGEVFGIVKFTEVRESDSFKGRGKLEEPDYFVKLDVEIAVDEQTRIHGQTV